MRGNATVTAPLPAKPATPARGALILTGRQGAATNELHTPAGRENSSAAPAKKSFRGFPCPREIGVRGLHTQESCNRHCCKTHWTVLGLETPSYGEQADRRGVARDHRPGRCTRGLPSAARQPNTEHRTPKAQKTKTLAYRPITYFNSSIRSRSFNPFSRSRGIND